MIFHRKRIMKLWCNHHFKEINESMGKVELFDHKEVPWPFLTVSVCVYLYTYTFIHTYQPG